MSVLSNHLNKWSMQPWNVLSHKRTERGKLQIKYILTHCSSQCVMSPYKISASPSQLTSRLTMAESSSASERSRSPSPARAVNAPKSSRTFVWLRELPKAIPRGKTWDQLNRDGRVKDIEFGKDFTERQMLKLVRENFTELGEADFSR